MARERPFRSPRAAALAERVVARADALGHAVEAAGRGVHLRVTTRPYPVHMWA
ncbi:MAG: hypothetical protein JWR81_5467, partial [Pseudonocardia sp.]|nr:hypothetical protein [Pseudonocardia sp.]